MILLCVIMTFSYCTFAMAEETNGSEETEVIDSSEITAALSRDSYKTIGFVRTPSVTCTDANGTILKKGIDYTVSYDSGRLKPGKYKVSIEFMGKYSGTRTLEFTIRANSGKVKKAGKWTYKTKKIKGKKVRIKTGYQYDDGAYPVGAAKIGKKYYFFKGTKGTLARGSKKQRIMTSGGLKFDVAPDGTLIKGWQVVNKKLYYFGGEYHSAVTNKKVDGIKLSDNGCAKTNLNAAVKKEAILLLESITDRNASKETQLRAVYQYMISHNNLSYMTKNPDTSDKDWVKKSAYNMLTTHSGSCSGFAAMFTVMANEIGYKETYVYYGRVHGTRDGAADGFTRHAISYVDGYLYDTEGVFADWLDDGWKMSGYITFIDVKKYKVK
ncbi:MAG: hypothetical protein J5517_05900 [Eubacterium sp.]|nr:hypothetical protein [Eubacterium sp.]